MEPLATQHCQTFDDFKKVLDLLEYKARLVEDNVIVNLNINTSEW